MMRFAVSLLLMLATTAAGSARVSSQPSAQVTAGPPQAETMLANARGLSNLHQPGTKPYRLQATFETYDYKGIEDGKGVVTEAYLREGYWQRFILYRDKHSTRTTVNGKSGTVSEPEFQSTFTMDHLLETLVAPVPSNEVLAKYKFAMKTLKAPGVSLDCVIGSLPYLAAASSASLDWHPGMVLSRNETSEVLTTAPNGVYCMDKDPAILRMIQGHNGLSYTFNRILRFGSVYVPGEITMMEAGKMRGHLRVDAIVATDVSEKDIILPAQDTVGPQVVSAALVSGRAKSKANPGYPEDAKRRHAQGTVVMHGLIGKDGHVRDLELISTPDDSLAFAAMNAARKWTYEPYQSGGVPVEVDTVLTVNFSLR